MHTINKTIAVIALSFTATAAVHAKPEVVAADAEVGTKLCVIASNGSVFKMAKAMKDASLSKRYVTSKITCNQQDIVSFVEQYSENPERMTRYLTRGTHNKDLLVSRVSAD